MRRRPPVTRAAGLVAVAGSMLIAGCTATTGIAPSLPPTAGIPAAPSDARVPAATTLAPATPTASTAPASPLPPERPPDATLAADGGDGVIGQLGSYTWGSAGSDSPWLPGSPLTVGAGEPLAVRFAGDVPVESWAARRTPGTATSDIGAVPVGTGAGALTFTAPPAGDWTVEVSVRFVGGGSASYAWRLTVD